MNILLGNITVLFGGIYEEVFLCKLYICSVRGAEAQSSVFLKLIHGRASVYLCEILPDEIEVLSVLRTDSLKLRLKGVGRILAYVILEYHALDIKLISDDRLEEIIELYVRPDIHVGDRLPVL